MMKLVPSWTSGGSIFTSLLTTISLTHVDNSEKCLYVYTIYSLVMTLPARRLAQTHLPNSKQQGAFELLKLTLFKASL